MVTLVTEVKLLFSLIPNLAIIIVASSQLHNHVKYYLNIHIYI